MATLVQVAPAQDLMRAINSPLGANTNTCPSDACATNNRPALSIVRPSGPLVPNVEQKRPTLATPPSFIKGTRQTALSRVIATNSTVSEGSSTRPLGLMPVSIRQSRRPPVATPTPAPGGGCDRG